MLLENFGLLGPRIGGLVAFVLGAHLIVFTLSNRLDEHFIALRNFGLVCAMVVIGLWLTAQGLLAVTEVSFGAGYKVAGGQAAVGDNAFRFPPWFDRGFLIASAASAAFYSGFAFQYWRGSR